MNEITRAKQTVFSSKVEYLAYINHWKSLARSKSLAREDCFLRCLLLGESVAKAFPLPGNAAGEESARGLARKALVALNPASNLVERLAAQRERMSRHGSMPDELQAHWSERWIGCAGSSRAGVLCPATLQRAVDLAGYGSLQ